MPIETALKRVTIRVRDVTKGKQEPWMEGSLTGDFYFIVSGNPQIQIQQAPTTADAAAWQAADSVANAAAYQAYLAEFPRGLYAAAARIKLASLRPSAVAAAPVTAPATTQAREPPRVTEEPRRPPPDRPAPATEQDARRLAAVGEMSLARLTGTRFQMGADSAELAENGHSDESAQPRHEVAVANFELAYYEVTVGQFRKFVEATGYLTEAERPANPGCHVPAKGRQWLLQPAAQWRAPCFAQTDSHPVVCIS